MSSESYAFGDTKVAADRLRLLTRLFEPEMTRFTRRWGIQRAKVAVDLGCGPGYTTQLLGETLDPGTLLGPMRRRGSSAWLKAWVGRRCISLNTTLREALSPREVLM